VIRAGALIVAATLLRAAFSASAQTDQQVEWCSGEDNASRELSISSCTALIQSGAYMGEELAIAFNNRGIAYFKSRQFERAIKDYEQAIRLRPNFLSALISRGFAYISVKNHGAAIEAFDAALKVNPENAASFYGRALVKRANGDAVGANADLAAAQQLDPTIAEELEALGVNLEAPPEFALLSPSAAQTSAPPEEESATSRFTGETASLVSAALALQTNTPPIEQSATPPAPAEETGSSLPAALPVTTDTPAAQQSATPPPIEKTASLPPAALPLPTNAPLVERNATPPPAPEETASLPLPAELAEALIERGNELLRRGDIAAARLAFGRAAAGGNRTAATGVAKTYDPIFLAQSGVRGLRGDPARAALWYGRAAAAGSREAQERLKRLRAQFPQ
jgi:tetratricopeptide (TPR) repeat protein